MTAGKEVPRRPPWLAVGLALVLCAFIYRLAATGGWSQPPTVPRLNQEQLEQLALSLGAAALPSAAGDVHHQGGGGKQWQWGPSRTPGTASRGGKYVITSVMGLQPERLNIFVASLRRWSPSTQLVVFVEEQTDSSLLKAAGAEVIPFKMPTDSALVLHRFELYKGYLKQLLERDSEAGVMLTDSRDVLLQADPWEHPLVQQILDEDGMLFSLEGGLAVGDVPLKAQPQNEHWVDTCFGKEVMKALADKPISCAGITIGSVQAMYGYVYTLLKTAFGTASPKCRYYGSDQAVHNYLLHALGPAGNLSFPYHVARNWDSPVHTAGYGWPIVIDKEGVYRRVEGDTPAIVHQYDRAYEATKVYLAMYPLTQQAPARDADIRWDGPECVKNLFLDTVVQCPPDGEKKREGGEKKGGDAQRRRRQQLLR